MSASVGWRSPGWKWGYANGKAHDVAMTTRASLQSRDERVSYIAKLVQDGKDVEDIEYLKMTLALRFQLASRQGKDGCGAGLIIMENMADCMYEDENVDLLISHLLELADKLPNDLQDLVGCHDDSLGCAAARVLAGTDFIELGL
jgi:hypothetical protein